MILHHIVYILSNIMMQSSHEDENYYFSFILSINIEHRKGLNFLVPPNKILALFKQVYILFFTPLLKSGC